MGNEDNSMRMTAVKTKKFSVGRVVAIVVISFIAFTLFLWPLVKDSLFGVLYKIPSIWFDFAVSNSTSHEVEITYDVDPNNFDIALLKSLYSKGNNVFYSPYSLRSALTVLYEGASGNTADEISPFIYSDYISDSLQDDLTSVNSLWVDTRFDLKQDYVSTVKMKHDAFIQNIDFRNDPDYAVRTINKFIEDSTHGTISDVLSPASITDKTNMILINTVYFLKDWEYPFDGDTKLESFSVDGGRTVRVDMMSMENTPMDGFVYGDYGKFEVIELPYEDSSVSMWIFLPSKGSSVIEVVDAIDSTGLDYYIRNSELTDFDAVYIPKFKLSVSYGMNSVLKALGLGDIFTENANFSNISDSPVYLDSLVQKAYIDVNEMSTEASAATLAIKVGSAPGTTSFKQPKIFRANRSFLFVIRDGDTGIMLFAGVLGNPKNL